MGQIFGMGKSSGEKTKATSMPNVPPALNQLYGRQTQLAEGGMSQYENLLRRALGGDRSVADPYTGSFASTYIPMAGSFIPGKEAYTAPYAAGIQQAQQQIQRATPSGGGQMAAMAQANMGGAMQMGQARAQQAQRDIDAQNALRQRDIQTQMGLAGQDVQNQNQMMQKLLNYYASVFGGFNPQAQVGTTQTQTTGGRLGLPFFDIATG